MKRTSTYICTVENTNLERTIAIRKHLTEIYGPLRARGRQVSFKIASSTLGTKWQLGDTRLDTKPDGKRG